MSISIAEALQLPAMQQTKLVAGEKGINNIIKWVTIVEVLEDFTRLQEGEFLITTGYGLEQDAERLAMFIDKLVERKLSGLAVHTGFYLATIPMVWLQAADRYGFPIIEIPRQYNFSTVTKAMLQQIINRQQEMTERGELLEELLDGRIHDPATLLARGKKLGYPLTDPQTIVCFRLQFPAGHTEEAERQQAREQLWQTAEYILRQKNIDGIFRQRLPLLYLLVCGAKKNGESAAYVAATEVVNHWQQYYPELPVTAGIGNAVYSPEKIAHSAKQAEYALLLGHLLPSAGQVHHFSALEPYHLLIEMAEKGVDLPAFYRRTLKDLVEHGSEKQSAAHSLLPTLEAYLQHNMNMQLTAAALYIHRHTLRYRLQQIEKKTGKSLASPHDRLQLQLAAMAYRLVQALDARQ